LYFLFYVVDLVVYGLGNSITLLIYLLFADKKQSQKAQRPSRLDLKCDATWWHELSQFCGFDVDSEK